MALNGIHPLSEYLLGAVPMEMIELEIAGGPTPADYEAARRMAEVVAARADVMCFGGKDGEAAEIAAQLARSLAVMSFLPGGVRVCRLLFCGAHRIFGHEQDSQVCERCLQETPQ